jgi:hypothetical protein
MQSIQLVLYPQCPPIALLLHGAMATPGAEAGGEAKSGCMAHTTDAADNTQHTSRGVIGRSVARGAATAAVHRQVTSSRAASSDSRHDTTGYCRDSQLGAVLLVCLAMGALAGLRAVQRSTAARAGEEARLGAARSSAG